MTQYIYAFDEGRISMKDLLGGKGQFIRNETSWLTSS